MMWSERHGHEVYVYHNGVPIYKRWNRKDGTKSQPSILLNGNGWPNEWIV